VESSTKPTSYHELVAEQTQALPSHRTITAERQLDSLLHLLKDRSGGKREASFDPLRELRQLTLKELVPAFTELVEKYAPAGITMQMDASNFLEGGREVLFEFCLKDYRIALHGTVTTEGIAFHETRYCPHLHGELATGPMLRLRGLNAQVFREFICERLTHLIRAVMRRR